MFPSPFETQLSSTMTPQIKTFLLHTLLTLLLLFFHSFSVNSEGFKRGINPANPTRKVDIQMDPKEITMADAGLDYDEPGANPRHDPRKGKPPGTSVSKSP